MTVTKINSHAFYNCAILKTVEIPRSVTAISYYGLGNCSSLKTIYYDGTIAEFDTVASYYWGYCTPEVTVVCTDGSVTR